MANLIALYRLQQTDKQIGEISEELELLKNNEEISKELKEAENRFEQIHLNKRDMERSLKDATLKLGTLEAEKKQLEQKLYSGKIVNSKELSQLERELEQLKKQRDKLDEQILHGMDEVEKVSKDVTVEQDTFEKMKIQFEKEKVEKELRVGNLTRQVEELKIRRETFVNSVDQDLIHEYDGLKRRKGGIAVAKLQRNSCSACYMVAPESTLQKVKVLELEYCSSCGRILYLDKEK